MSVAVPPEMLNRWWYYSMELQPGVVTKGAFPAAMPNFPRMFLRRMGLSGAACLDLGSMEGLTPVLMRRQGASPVYAVDATNHCVDKLKIVRDAYDAPFGFRSVGLMYDLYKKLGDLGPFDVVNVSGLLYHVISPLHVLAGARSLLKPGGLMIVSTNVVERDDYTMEWNHAGRLQAELNTFWYIAPPALESMLQWLQLEIVDALYQPLQSDAPAVRDEGLPVGYLGVVCRATNDPDVGGAWAADSRRHAWEWQGTLAHEAMAAYPPSGVTYRAEATAGPLFAMTQDPARRRAFPAAPGDGHLLRLDDRS